jgi:SCY1-like protein 2
MFNIDLSFVDRVVPCLAKEFANPAMIPFVLPIVLQVAEKCSKEEYMQHIFVHLRPVMKLTDPVQVRRDNFLYVDS